MNMIYWKDLNGYEGIYVISKCGKIKSLDRNVISGKMILYRKGVEIKQRIGKFGYKYLTLSHNKNKKTVKTHRLVALNFIPNPENKPCVNHIDGDKLNNNVENLEWVTHSENTRHAHYMGLKKGKKGEESHFSKITIKDVLKIKKEYSIGNISQLNLGLKYGISQSQVWRIVNNINWNL